MVQFLERPESKGDKIMRGLGIAAQSIPDLISSYNENKQKQAQSKEKILLGGPSRISKTLKSLGLETYLNDKDLSSINQDFAELVNQGHSEYDALNAALGKIKQARDSGEGAGQSEPFARANLSFLPKAKEPFSRDKFIERATHPEDLEFIKEHPGKAAASAGLGAAFPLEEFAKLESRLPSRNQPFSIPDFLTGKQSQDTQEAPNEALQGKQKSILGLHEGFQSTREKINEGLSEKQKSQASKLEVLGGFLPFERVFSGLTKIGKNLGFLKNAEKIAAKQGITAEQAAQHILQDAEVAGIDLAKVAEGDRQSSGKLFNHSNKLAGRAGKPLESATEMRVARTKPEARIFPRQEKVQLREAQVKAHPKYVEEIAQDAAERAARAESRVPKTIKGMDSKKLRMHEAEKNWPKAQESYNKAAGRVRALEDEVAILKGEQKSHAEQILDLAKKELADAEFGMKQAFENLKGVNVRAGLPAMREAAHKKLLGIQESIAAGEEYKIAKMDYSPDLINKAKAISKSKPIPKAKESDFYTQVHDVYAGEYKKRLDQVNKELAQSSKGLADVYKKQQLAQEKDILSKMIQSADAEKTIQNRRFGLREVSERHKAQQRFKELKPAHGEPKVSVTAQEKMWKERIQEIKTPEGRSKIAEDIVEEAAKKNPKIADQIRKEKSGLEEALDKVAKKKKEIEESLSTGIKDPSKAKSFGNKIANDFKELIDSFAKGDFSFMKTTLGKDVTIGIFTAIFDDILKQNGIPLTGSSIIGAVHGGFRRGSYRTIANQATKWALKEFHLHNASQAYKRHDERRLKEFSPSVRKEAKRRAFK